MASLMAAWPTVALGEALRQRRHIIQIDDTKEYKRCRVQLHAQGIVLRDRVMGIEVKTKSQQVCRASEFLVAEIDAKVGGFGIVPGELDGAIVSSHYFLFVVDETRLDTRFLDYYIRIRAFQDQVQAQGSTNYAAIRPADVLSYTIPLPPLDEQRRIVARIEALAARIEEARGLRREAGVESTALWKAEIRRCWMDEDTWRSVLLKDLVSPVSGQVNPQIEPYVSLPHVNGEAIEVGTCKLLNQYVISARDAGVSSGKFHFHSGAVLYSKIRPYLMKAVQVPFDGVCSADIYAFEDFAPIILPRFFMYSLVSPRFTSYSNSLSGRTRMPKLNQNQLFAFQFPCPPLDVQQRIVTELDDMQTSVGNLQRHQAETDAELDALLPSILDKAFRGEL